VNKVILIGHLGRDPETWTTASRQVIAKLRLATTDRYQDKNTGEKREQTQWHTLVAWGRLAEICAHYLQKGSHICAEGKLIYRQWQDQDGNKRTATEISLENMTMLNKPKQRDHNGATSSPDEGEDIPF
jgi:single-strand DNA-binding protein